MDITNQDLKTFEYYYCISLKDDRGEAVSKELATKIEVIHRNSDGKYIGVTIKDTGQKFTIESLMKIVTAKKSETLF